MKKIFVLIALAASTVLLPLASCSKEKEEPAAEISIVAVDPEIKPSELYEKIYVPTKLSTFSMNITSTQSWTAECSEKWAKILPASGAANETVGVKITIAANSGEESRSCTVKVISGSTQKVLTFEQYGTRTAPAEVKVTGLDEKISLSSYETKTIEFTVESNRSWAITASDWIICTPATGNANAVTAVKMVIAANYALERTGSVVIKAAEASSEHSVYQPAYSGPALDTHPAGTVFYSENFDWIKDIWPDKYTKYGLCSVKLDGTNWNEYQVIKDDDTGSAFTAKGYSNGSDYNDYTYVKYEGFIKLGSSSKLGMFRTLALDGQNSTVAIDAGKVAKVMLSFDAMLYLGTDGSFDPTAVNLDLSLTGSGTIAICGSEDGVVAADGKSATLPLSGDETHRWKFVTKNVLITGADQTTRIVFGGNQEIGTRPMIDNIKIVRAENSEASAPADVFAALPAKESEIEGQTVVVESLDGIAAISVRINRPWTVTSSASWAKLGPITAGTVTTSPAKIAEGGLSAEEPGTYLPTIVKVTCENNTVKSPREAEITITDSEGNATAVKITQKADSGIKEIAKWTFTSLYTDTYTHSDGKVYTPNENAKKNARAWCDSDKKGTHNVPDDYHNAATFSAVNASGATFEYSTATSSQVWDRLRLKGMTKDDYFQFKINSLTAASGDKVALKYAYLCAANGSNTPQSWKEQYSYDGANWTDIKSIGKLANTPADWASLDCEIVLDKALADAPFYIRVVALDNAVSPSNSIPYIAVDPEMAAAATNYATRTKYYTDAKDFITILLIKAE